MATKFAKQFQQSNKDLYASRGEAVAQQMSNASEQIKLHLKNEKFRLDMELNEMMDFGKTHTTSLDIKNPESYNQFIKRLVEKKKELALLEIDIEIHEELHNEWFAEEEQEAPKARTRKTTGSTK